MPSSESGERTHLFSRDGNINLVGSWVQEVQQEADQGEEQRTEFWLEELTVKYATLITVTTSAEGSQTLHSLNCDTSIFTVSPHAFDTPPSPAKPLLVTLQSKLLSVEQLVQSIAASPFYSNTFEILLDGPGFPLPRFSLESLVLSPTLPPMNSPTIQRLLLSPLLSPHRAASHSPDPPIPALNLGISRTRAASISGVSPISAGVASSIHSFIAPATQTVSSTLSSTISSHNTTTANEIMIIRRAHDAYVRRVKAEASVLEARAASIHAPVGNGLLVRGFGNSNTASSRSRERDASRERDLSKDREDVEERGRKVRDEINMVDEATSKRMIEEDLAEEDARGRSRSRTRGGDDLSPVRSKSRTTNGTITSATTNDEDDDEDDDDLSPVAITTHDVLQGLASPNIFVPHSHVLVSIPESEEMSLPPSKVASPALIPSRPRSTMQRRGVDEEEEDENDDVPFEMDEDLDIDEEFLLTSPATYDTPLPSTFESPTSPLLVASTSFRPGSYRPSALSSSYAALLSSSLSNQRPTAFPPSPDFGPVASSRVVSSSSLIDHPTRPKAREEALATLALIDPPDARSAQQAERTRRDVLALDAPSHRPLRRRAGSIREDRKPRLGEEEDVKEEEGTASSRYTMGSSVPISMSFASSRATAAASLSTERSGRDDVRFTPALSVVPSAKRSPAEKSDLVSSVSISITSRAMPASTMGMGGPSSLARSLRHPPPMFGRAETNGYSEEEKILDDEVESFVPPHVWVKVGEDLMSRSIGKF